MGAIVVDGRRSRVKGGLLGERDPVEEQRRGAVVGVHRRGRRCVRGRLRAVLSTCMRGGGRGEGGVWKDTCHVPVEEGGRRAVISTCMQGKAKEIRGAQGSSMELKGEQGSSREIDGDHVLLERLLLIWAPTELSLGKAAEESLGMLPREPN